ncbi:hypothetical protein EYZ11_007213 [Aspergillus tanneri]|uniref:Uncharacterized protein n=1 Tax=Aspergillus tanneri TaxID=1220188 RepID=A0A4V3UP16_9EURO|nr:uncharacterized protein ATNIH1004_001732 [Aspergillus tanneri]KAA8652823.1 hypothetical protein ATNIH1004_001732 [Aspergillus tanneri]THC93324.1 hypothetical protein EYZ11_007213 [Aspergillus tanneri]
MVLDDSSPQAEQFSSTIENPEFPLPKHLLPLRVRPETIVRPDIVTMAFYPGSYAWRHTLRSSIVVRLNQARVGLQRLPSQEEADAMITHCSRKIYVDRTGAPLGVIGFLLWEIRKLNKLDKADATPRKDHTTFSPQRARPSLMRLFRPSNIGSLFLWSFSGMFFTSIYASTQEQVNSLKDLRLAAYREELASQDQNELHRRQLEALRQSMQGLPNSSQTKTPSQEQEQQDQRSEAAWWDKTTQQRSGASEPKKNQHDSLYSQGTLSQLIADQTQGRSFFDDYDDASPTAPAFKAAERAQQKYPEGNSWERIRQQAISGSSQQDQRDETQQGQGGWNSWGSSSFSSGGYDRHQERQQSQAEFDRLLESERNIGSDSWDTKGWEK